MQLVRIFAGVPVSAVCLCAIVTLLAATATRADQHAPADAPVLDRVELRDGTVLEGLFLGGSSTLLRIRVDKGVQGVEVEQVRALHFAARRGEETRDPSADGRHVVPTGTVLRVRLEETLSSTRSRTGQPFRAILLTDLSAPDKLLAPAGQEIWGRVTLAHRDTRRRRDGELDLELAVVEVAARRRPLKTGRHKIIEAVDDGETPSAGEVRIAVGTILEFVLSQPFIFRERNF